MKKIDLDKFKKWLVLNGAEILPLTNEYEILRFQAKEIGVLYKSGKTNSEYTKNAIWCWRHNEQWDGKPIKTGRYQSYKKEKKLLLQRDGDNCFYCGEPMYDDISLEHLIPLSAGGKNTLGNMVLAHKQCNNDVKYLQPKNMDTHKEII